MSRLCPEIGTGTSTLCAPNRPHEIKAIEGVEIRDLVSGLNHVTAIDAEKKVYTWGSNSHGQTGHGSNHLKVGCPLVVKPLLEKDVVTIKCGHLHSAALTSTGELLTWGCNTKGQLGHDSRENGYHPMRVLGLRSYHILQIACGGYHTLAMAYRQVFAWGSGQYGQLGLGKAQAVVQCPELIKESSAALHLHDIQEICAGENHSGALTESGYVLAWGRGEYGSLGTGYEASQLSPVQLEAFNGRARVTSLSMGGDHSCAITFNGDLYMWGRNSFGQLGLGTFSDAFVPTLVPFFNEMEKPNPEWRLKSVSCGPHHTTAVDDAGQVWTWGRGDYGQLGHTVLKPKTVTVPALVEGLLGMPIAKAVAGDNHSVALSLYGQLLSWGRGNFGQLGHSSKPNQASEAALAMLPKSKERGFTRQFGSTALYKSVLLPAVKQHPSGKKQAVSTDKAPGHTPVLTRRRSRRLSSLFETAERKGKPRFLENAIPARARLELEWDLSRESPSKPVSRQASRPNTTSLLLAEEEKRLEAQEEEEIMRRLNTAKRRVRRRVKAVREEVEQGIMRETRAEREFREAASKKQQREETPEERERRRYFYACSDHGDSGGVRRYYACAALGSKTGPAPPGVDASSSPGPYHADDEDSASSDGETDWRQGLPPEVLETLDQSRKRMAKEQEEQREAERRQHEREQRQLSVLRALLPDKDFPSPLIREPSMTETPMQRLERIAAEKERRRTKAKNRLQKLAALEWKRNNCG
mmetsp:Transcript_17810/g.41947  ORF Transcript_17810/g.41947 Transcript_17810/m.41947 type:complete len:753 (-) Transcript_17810:62-2320(-)